MGKGKDHETKGNLRTKAFVAIMALARRTRERRGMLMDTCDFWGYIVRRWMFCFDNQLFESM